jgi:hypothetical protein
MPPMRYAVMCTVRDSLVPMPNVDAQIIDCDNRFVIMVTVQPIATNPCGMPLYQVRHGVTNMAAEPQEISNLALSCHLTAI